MRYMLVVFFFKQKTAYEMLRSLVGSEMCIRDREIPSFQNSVLQLHFNMWVGAESHWIEPAAWAACLSLIHI